MARKRQSIALPEVITEIHSLSPDGRGIAYINEKISFISGALPAEQVKCRLTKRHARYNEGEVVAVLQASKDRITPRCTHVNVCGGCSLQHLDVVAQIQF